MGRADRLPPALVRPGNQDYRREVFLGLVLETYHYINSASRHISTAIAHCTDPAWTRLLSEYLSEEYDHA